MAIGLALILAVLRCGPWERTVNVFNNTPQAMIVQVEGLGEWSVAPDHDVTPVADDTTVREVVVLSPLTCEVVARGLLPSGPVAVVINGGYERPPVFSLSIRVEDAMSGMPADRPNAAPCSN